MANLKPFAGASNRTAVVVLERGRPTTYPVPYSHWYKPGGGSVIPEDVTLEDVTTEKIATYRQFYAEPVDEADPTSPWITGRERALMAVRKVLGTSDYQAHAGVYTGGANGVYWVEIAGRRPDGLVVVSNLTKGAKRQVDNVHKSIEPDLLYPLLRGRDVHRWQAKPSAYILMVQDPEKRRGYDADWLNLRYPETHAYLKHFENVLLQRRDRGTRGLIEKGAPFYSMFAVGDYTFAPYKVVWRYIASEFTCAVISTVKDETLGDKLVIPNEKLMLVSCHQEAEAYALCAFLNSAPVRFGVQSFMISTQIAPHIISRLSIPVFLSANLAHRQLAALSQQAHEATAAGDAARVREIEAEIDRLAAELWGLSEQELEEIQRSLEELSS